MKDNKYSTMRADELQISLNKLRADLFDMRAQRTTGKIEDTSKFKKVRRDIARVLTAQRAQAIAAGAGTKAGNKAGTKGAKA